MKKQKLAVVNVFFPPQEIGGATRVVADQVSVLLDDYSDQYDLVAFTTEESYSELSHQLIVYPYHGIPVYKANCIFREHMDWHPRDPEMVKLFRQFLEYEQPDIIHFHCIQRLTGSVIEAALDCNIPYWVTIHDAWWISDYQFLVDDKGTVYPEGHPDPYVDIALKAGVTQEESLERRSYLKKLLHKAKGVLTVSESFADIYRKNGISQIQVNKNGISSKISWQAKHTDYTDKIVCAHIGGMSEHKGYYMFKQAIEKLKLKNIEVLVVDLSQIESYVSNTFWQDVPVTFIGRASRDNIVALYRRIDVLFAPSIWPESFGLVTREAAACGCWVVASDIGGIGEDVIEGKNGYKIRVENVNALCQIIKKIDSRPSIYKGMPEKMNKRHLVNDQVSEFIRIISIT